MYLQYKRQKFFNSINVREWRTDEEAFERNRYAEAFFAYSRDQKHTHKSSVVLVLKFEMKNVGWEL